MQHGFFTGKQEDKICPWIPDLVPLSPHSNPSPFPLPLGESHPTGKGLSQDQGVCKHLLNENTWTFWVNVPKWCCKPLLVVASKKRISESMGPSYMRAVCWEFGQLCTPEEEKVEEMGIACCPPCVVPHCLCCLSCLKIPGSSPSIYQYFKYVISCS